MTRWKTLLLFISLLLIARCVQLNEARKAYDSKDYRTTIALCKQAVAEDSTDSAALLLLAKSYRSLDSLDIALGMAEKSEKYAADPEDAILEKCRIYLEMGDGYAAGNNLRTALDRYRSAERLCPENVEAVLRVAETYHELNRLDDARIRYEKISVLLADPSLVADKLEEILRRTDDSRKLAEEGIAAYRKQHYITARTKLNEALQLKMDDDEAQYYLHMANGHIYFKKGSRSDLWDAIESFGKATAVRNDVAEPHYWLARAYEKKDDDEFVNAIDEYETALRLDPRSAMVEEIQERLVELKKRKERLDAFWGR